MNRLLLVVALVTVSAVAYPTELVHQFQSPAFIPGNGYSQHVLSIHQLEENKAKEIKAETAAALAKAEAAAKQTNLAKFLVNFGDKIFLIILFFVF